MTTRQTLDSTGADIVMEAAAKYATAHGHRVVIAVVDHHGRLMKLERLPGTQLASDQVAIDKARTAAIFVRPSREIERQVSGGRLGALALHGAAALVGGVPLVADGQVVGAVGTSGETPDEDEAVSNAGAASPFTTTAIPDLSLDEARRAAETAAAEAARRGVAPVVAVVDAGGEPVYLHRPDRAQVASVGVSIDKARTAALFRRPSKDFEVQAATGRPSALHLAGAVPLQGGVPLLRNGMVVGGIGVSGASSADEDNELAELGAAEPVPAGAVMIDRATMESTWVTGGLVFDDPGYKVDAGRRHRPGEVEYHERVVDVMYVIEGEATVVTGGEMEEPRVTGPGELRASRTEGGTTHRIAQGDVLVVPERVPHHFTAVTDPFRYYVVKVAR